jgi:hypothetical protein
VEVLKVRRSSGAISEIRPAPTQLQRDQRAESDDDVSDMPVLPCRETSDCGETNDIRRLDWGTRPTTQLKAAGPRGEAQLLASDSAGALPYQRQGLERFTRATRTLVQPSPAREEEALPPVDPAWAGLQWFNRETVIPTGSEGPRRESFAMARRAFDALREPLRDVPGFAGAAIVEVASGEIVASSITDARIDFPAAGSAAASVVRTKRTRRLNETLPEYFEDVVLSSGESHHIIRPFRTDPSSFLLVFANAEPSVLPSLREIIGILHTLVES